MRKTNIFTVLIIVVICFSACNRFVRRGGGGAAPPSKSKVKIITLDPILIVGQSRYAPLENLILTIAFPVDDEEMHSSIQELLEMCESEETLVQVYEERYYEDRTFLEELTLREYIDLLLENKYADVKVDHVVYNEEGKITLMKVIPW